MRIVAVSAGLGIPSSSRLLADRLADAVRDQVNDAIEIEVVELRDHAHELVNLTLTGVAPDRLRAVLDAVAGADGLIVVSPIFNAAMSGLFKMFFDALDEGTLRGVPVLLAATGGTARHSLAIDQSMLPMFFYLKARVVPTSVFVATDDWGGADDSRVQQAALELVSMLSSDTDRPVAQQTRRTASDDFTLDADFEQLLERVRQGGRL